MSQAAELVVFVLRETEGAPAEMTPPFPDLLTWQEEGGLPHIPVASANAGEDLRKRAINLIYRQTGLGTFSAITPLASGDETSAWLFLRREPFGSLGRWHHVSVGRRVRVYWTPLDGNQRLEPHATELLARFETQLLTSF